MINLSCLMFFVCSVSYLQGASEQAYIWKQPIIGTQEEAQVIKSFNCVHYKQSDNGFADDSALPNLIRDTTCLKHIKKEIQYCISERIDEIKIRAKQLNQDIPSSFPMLEPQTFLNKWWHKKQLKYMDTDVRALFSLKSEMSINDEEKQTDLNKMYINGLAHRAQLYAQLYNQLDAIKERKAEVSALHIELLFDVCEALKPDNGDSNNRLQGKSELLGTFLQWKKRWLSARERLLAQGDQRLLNPINESGLYTITKGAVRTALMFYPPYMNDNDCRDPNDDIEADASNIMIRDHYDRVVGSRALYSSEDSYHHDVPKHDVRFCDALFGFDVLCALNEDKNKNFKYCASQWITTDIGTEEEKNFAILGYTVNNISYIAKVDLPKSSERQYCIHMPCNRGDQKVNILLLKMPVISERIDTRNICNCGTGAINAVAYDVGNNYMLYASKNALMRGWPSVAFKNGSQLSVIHTFTNHIKKICVVSENAYLVLEEDNSLHVVFYAQNPKIQPFQLSMQNIIDIAYDGSSKKLFVLTKNGVFSYTCVTSKQCSDDVGPQPRDIQGPPKSLTKFRLQLMDSRGNDPAIDVRRWNIELQDHTEVKNDSFAYDQHRYNAIEIVNGQVYLKFETKDNYNLAIKKVLIYPPLSGLSC